MCAPCVGERGEEEGTEVSVCVCVFRPFLHQRRLRAAVAAAAVAPVVAALVAVVVASPYFIHESGLLPLSVT